MIKVACDICGKDIIRPAIDFVGLFDNLEITRNGTPI